jgi:hypothetical protein
VNWDTTPKTSSPVTAVSGNGYFINTTSGAITVNLPATPAAGDIVAIADYANTSATNNITVGRNGSNIDGSAIDAKIKINGQVYTLVYVDATEGWKTVGQTFNQISTAEFVAATGGCVATCGDYKIHTFTGPGTFTVSNAGNASGSNVVDYLVVAGGGGGGGGTPCGGGYGGAGAGGFRESKATGAPWTASPLASSTSLPVSATAYPITVGGGGPGGPGPGGPYQGTVGVNSVFSTITSAGGGYGGTASTSPVVGGNGGSGGGPGYGPSPSTPTTAGAGNTPPVNPPQGNPSGTAIYAGPAYGGAGGGGATSAGGNGSGSGGGAGGNGATTSISTTSITYAGGGGGGPGGAAGPGGGGAGGGGPGVAGTTNRGGGGGGGGLSSGGNGGSGIVIIRYKFQ